MLCAVRAAGAARLAYLSPGPCCAPSQLPTVVPLPAPAVLCCTLLVPHVVLAVPCSVLPATPVQSTPCALPVVVLCCVPPVHV